MCVPFNVHARQGRRYIDGISTCVQLRSAGVLATTPAFLGAYDQMQIAACLAKQARCLSALLWFQLNSTWHSILTIPAHDFGRYTLRPLKWLRFLAYTIYGREGTLRTEPTGLDLDDYMTDVGSLNENYYYVSPDTPRLVDVRAINDRTTDMHTHTQSSQEDFKSAIVQRDGTCIITDEDAEFCHAAHCVPYAKGEDYIQRLTKSRGNSDAEVIDDINDPRNGLLVYVSVHSRVGNGTSTFLKTPNFSMATEDVPPSPRPVTSRSGRLTLQYFFDSKSRILSEFAPNNQDARLPEDLSTWPPALIIDFMYGSAAVHKWGSETTVDMLYGMVKDTYYVEPTPEAAYARIERRKQDRADRALRRAEKAAAGRGEPREMSRDDIMDILMFLWSQPSTSGTQPQPEPRPKDDSSEQEHESRTKVEAWLQKM